MNEQKKADARDARKPVSREKMLEYLYRHKLKKKYRPVRPHTFANSQGLSTRQLQREPSIDAKKPIINKNVKARLESNLQFLLENQNLNAARVKKPESFISLNVKRLKSGGTTTKSNDGSTQTGESRHSGSNQNKRRGPSTVISMQKSPASASNRLSSKSVAFHNAEQSQSVNRLMPPPDLPTKSGHISKKHNKDCRSDALTLVSSRSLPFGIPDADSFDFCSIKNQDRAGQKFISPTSSKSRQTGKTSSKKRSSDMIESPSSAFRFDNDNNFGFDPVQARNLASHTPPTFSNEPDPFFDNRSHTNFDAAQARGWTVSSNFDGHAAPFDAEFKPRSHSGHFRSSGHRSSANLADSFESRTSSANRFGRGTVQKTRIIKSSVSRVGESPFMEQIVIQKMKQKF